MLDLVITNVPDRGRVREMFRPKESDVFTDHGTVSFEFHAYTKANHKIKRTVYDYRNGDFDSLRGALEALNSDAILFKTATTSTWTGLTGRTHL